MDVLVLIRLVRKLECIKPIENLEIYEDKHPVRKRENHKWLIQSMKKLKF